MPSENTKPRQGTVKSAKRREELRRAIPKPGIDFKALFLRRDLVNTLLIFFGFFIVTGAITRLSHSDLRLEPGQVMTRDFSTRVGFTVEDVERTAQQRRAARETAANVYVPNQRYLSDLRAALRGLPVAVHEQLELANVARALIDDFELTVNRLADLQAHAADGLPTQLWADWVDAAIDVAVIQNPTLSSDRDQQEQLRGTRPLFTTGTGSLRAFDWIRNQPNALAENQDHWGALLEEAGVPGAIAPMFVARLVRNPQPTYLWDDGATRRRAQTVANAVETTRTTHQPGEPIYQRGDVLSASQLALLHREREEFQARRPRLSAWYELVGTLGLVGLVTAFIAGYLIRFYPGVVHNPLRVVALATLCAVCFGAAIFISSSAPSFVYFAAVSTTLFVGMILVIAYDQRLASMVTALQCALTTFALGEGAEFFIILLAAGGAAIAGLREVRHRNTLIRASVMAAAVAGVGALLVGIYQVPVVDHNFVAIDGAWRHIWTGAAGAAFASLFVGFMLLGILPSIERRFDMTTGMTMIELRDTRQPLLRQLQERAPGTYNHSLQVASVAEAAADAIGADSLLTYVGALYHDIGKMNKPSYFVENQSGGPNKHEKLSPAMSLLVIVGHVKDGVELAREYKLPRSIIHFIESHHGTTLVEYFYHAARSKAEAEGQGEGDRVDEIEFRYSGPRPRSREAAILMLSDAVESATRAMDDPAPRSIENLVRKLSRKRLLDGQFDECDLTLRDLTQIEEAIIKSVWALHHGRIAYPSNDADHADDELDAVDPPIHATQSA